MAHASSAHSSFGRPVSARMTWIHLQIILFAHSATPFCSGVYGAISSSWIPVSHHNSAICFWYSPLPSVRIDLMQRPSCSKIFLNMRKHSFTSFTIFVFSTKRYVIQVAWSINVRKYLDSPNTTGSIYLQMSLWMRSPGSIRRLIGESLLRLRVCRTIKNKHIYFTKRIIVLLKFLPYVSFLVFIILKLYLSHQKITIFKRELKSTILKRLILAHSRTIPMKPPMI